MADIQDWTIDPATGLSNSSEKFKELVREVSRLIQIEPRSLLSGNTDSVAQLIMAHLAHNHGLSPVANRDQVKVECPRS